MLPWTACCQSFRIVPLGVKGGIDEGNLSAYMAAPLGSNRFVCLDAGTLDDGIEKAVANHVFDIDAEKVLRRYIKGYLISHAHLDHVAGLIINAPEDTAKNIYGLGSTIQTLETHYFTWESWANFADQGEPPLLKKYHYKVLAANKEVNITNTSMTVRAFPLSHSNLISTAFLLRHNLDCLLYLGDTGPDKVEKSHNLYRLWQAIAPLIKARKLKGIMIEVSFPDEQPDKSLFGHLTPRWLMNEMNDLALLTGKSTLKGLPVVIVHLKPPRLNIDKIKSELRNENKLALKLIFPVQGKPIDL